MIVLERTLAAPPEAAFALLTDPDAMNLWSRARVTLGALGDRDAPWGTGAVRAVVLRFGGARLVLREVVERSEPPHLFVYRVFAGAPVRNHRGTITIVRDGDRSRVAWRVEIEPIVPGTASVIEALLRPDLEASLDRLVAIAPSAPARAFDVERDLSEARELEALYARAETVREAQRALADRFAKEDDLKRWFARIYQFVTEAQIDACRRGLVRHPGWVLRLVERFHDFYVENLERASGERDGEVEGHWRRAFRARRPPRDAKERAEAIGRSLLLGVRAHIEDDLPRAIASVYFRHYRTLASYARFRADFLAMTSLFHGAQRRIVELLPKGTVPLSVRAFDALLPRELVDRVEARSYYDLQKRRREAFERGARIAALLEAERVAIDRS